MKCSQNSLKYRKKDTLKPKFYLENMPIKILLWQNFHIPNSASFVRKENNLEPYSYSVKGKQNIPSNQISILKISILFNFYNNLYLQLLLTSFVYNIVFFLS